MKETCEIVRDLLPLYADGVCSDESRKLVDSHISSCGECRNLLKALQNHTVEETLAEEATTAFRHHARAFRRKGVIVGSVIACILMIPVIVCLIVNLATGHALDWFFIVLSALLLTASLTVVPLVVSEHKFLWCFGTSLGSLLLLLTVCALYSGGRWLFVAASSVLFGISVVFFPIVVHCQPLKRVLGRQKGLIAMTADTFFLFLMLFCIGCHVRSADYPHIAAAVSLPLVLYAWGMFLLIRYPLGNGVVRSGLCVLFSAVFFFFADSFVGYLLRSPAPLPVFHPFVWNAATLDGNISWIILLGGALLGLLLVFFGCIFGKRGKTK